MPAVFVASGRALRGAVARMEAGGSAATVAGGSMAASAAIVSMSTNGFVRLMRLKVALVVVREECACRLKRCRFWNRVRSSPIGNESPPLVSLSEKLEMEAFAR